MSADTVVRDDWPAPLEYMNEDELRTLEGWAKYQGFDLAALTEPEAADVRAMFDDAAKRRETTKKVGRMKLKATPGEARYAVAVRDGDDLSLALWVRRSP